MDGHSLPNHCPNLFATPLGNLKPLSFGYFLVIFMVLISTYFQQENNFQLQCTFPKLELC